MDTKKEELMTILVDSLKGIKDFTLEQAPDVLQQWLGMEMLTAGAWIISLAVLGLSCLWLTRSSYCEYKDPDSIINESDAVLNFFFGLLGFLGSTTGVIINTVTLLQIYLFPKAYLLKSLL